MNSFIIASFLGHLKGYQFGLLILVWYLLTGREVVFQCRDEGPIRARVRWVRPSGRPLPSGSRDVNGRLEIPNIKVSRS